MRKPKRELARQQSRRAHQARRRNVEAKRPNPRRRFYSDPGGIPIVRDRGALAALLNAIGATNDKGNAV